MSRATWHYLSITYDISGTTWSASFYANGVLVASGTRSASAETAGNLRSGGFADFDSSFPLDPYTGLIGQMIAYDSSTSAADAASPLFVSRLEPNSDLSDTGSWTPASGGTNQVGVTANNPYNDGTYCENTTPSSADNIQTELNNLSAQLGLSGVTVSAVTSHTYSSGSGVDAFVSVRDSLQSYTDGSNFPPSPTGTSYEYVTTTTGLSTGSTLNLKYEVV